MGTVTTRSAVDADLPFVKAFIVALYEHVDQLTPRSERMGPAWAKRVEEHIGESWADYTDFIAIDEGIPVGVVRSKEVPAGTWSKDTFRVELTDLYILPAYRRGGVGSMLIRQVLDWAKSMEYPEVFLYVHPSNTSAIKLYERHGFEQIESVWLVRLSND